MGRLALHLARTARSDIFEAHLEGPPSTKSGIQAWISDGRLYVDFELNGRILQRSAGGQRLERFAGLDENPGAARCGLVAADNHIDIERV
jgi:hypothetical protein